MGFHHEVSFSMEAQAQRVPVDPQEESNFDEFGLHRGLICCWMAESCLK